MNPVTIEAIKTFLSGLLKDAIPDKDINVELTIKINISKPKKENEDV
jgi:hypothetical protein